MNIVKENNIKKRKAFVTMSIVSHGQSDLIKYLLEDLREYCDSNYEVILTLNIPEQLSFNVNLYPFTVHVINNVRPKGFSANHNTAFSISSSEYFCVLNPDIRLTSNPFPVLIACFENKNIGVTAPKVISPEGELEDSVRPFPTPFSIMAKALNFGKKQYIEHEMTNRPHWVAGMFMLFQNTVFRTVGGFDERYFLYYEDVDICARLKLSGYNIEFCPNATVVHDAQRRSHRDLKYLLGHLSSMARYFTSKVFVKTLLSN